MSAKQINPKTATRLRVNFKSASVYKPAGRLLFAELAHARRLGITNARIDKGIDDVHDQIHENK